MKERIRKIVAKYGTRDPFELADAMGAITITTPLYDGTRGYYTYHKRNGIICIDESLSDEDARIVCAHELGHFVLHRTENTILLKNTTFVNTNKFEIQANKFAAHLLVPDSALLEYKDTEFCISQIAADLGVPKSILELKFLQF
ncbi:ImmA/IrrE family metallo-endopeptidase [Eubacterium sp.]|uniref:ImmA/IrrE family metallo-endopeptidase n=1 Tax=Eubacterium sp. TaxID=142586 RepID=UPI002FC643CC